MNLKTEKADSLGLSHNFFNKDGQTITK